MAGKQSSGYKFSVAEMDDIKQVLASQASKDLIGMDSEAYTLHVMYLMRKVRVDKKTATEAHVEVMATYPGDVVAVEEVADDEE